MAEAKKMGLAATLLRRGATLMEEPCPKCGGLMIRFKGRRRCINEDDLSSLAAREAEVSPSEAVAPVEGLVLQKVEQLIEALRAEGEIKRQTDLATLLLRYLEILDRVKRMRD